MSESYHLWQRAAGSSRQCTNLYLLLWFNHINPDTVQREECICWSIAPFITLKKYSYHAFQHPVICNNSCSFLISAAAELLLQSQSLRFRSLNPGSVVFKCFRLILADLTPVSIDHRGKKTQAENKIIESSLGGQRELSSINLDPPVLIRFTPEWLEPSAKFRRP